MTKSSNYLHMLKPTKKELVLVEQLLMLGVDKGHTVEQLRAAYMDWSGYQVAPHDETLLAFSEVACYLANLYNYAHGDRRSGVIASLDVDFVAGSIKGSSVLPESLASFISILSEDHGGLIIESDGSSLVATVDEDSAVYLGHAWGITEELATNIVCFRLLNGLVFCLHRERYWIDTSNGLTWRRSSDLKPFELVADFIVDGWVTSCPWCGRPVVLKNRSNPSPFCKPADSNSYLKMVKRELRDGMAIDEAIKWYGQYVMRDTLLKWCNHYEELRASANPNYDRKDDER